MTTQESDRAGPSEHRPLPGELMAPDGDLLIRPATPDDSRSCHRLLWESVTDLGSQRGTRLQGTADEWWSSMAPIHAQLAHTAAEWWVAEDRDSHELVGYARSIERGGLFELTEFFVQPGRQSRGLGRALIERAFPTGRGEVRSIIATTDVRALNRYYAAGTAARFPILTLAGAPRDIGPTTRLTPLVLGGDSAPVVAAGDVERKVLGYDRGSSEFEWLMGQREGYLYRSGDQVAGFAFVSDSGVGPIAVLDPADLPDVLLHLETRAQSMGLDRLEFEVPAPNEVAVRHLLGRGFRLDPWINLLMSNRPFGQFDRFIGFGPPLFL